MIDRNPRRSSTESVPGFTLEPCFGGTLTAAALGAGGLGTAKPPFEARLASRGEDTSGTRVETSTRVPVPGSLSFVDPSVGVNGLFKLVTPSLIDNVLCGLSGGLTTMGTGGGASMTGVGGR